MTVDILGETSEAQADNLRATRAAEGPILLYRVPYAQMTYGELRIGPHGDLVATWDPEADLWMVVDVKSPHYEKGFSDVIVSCVGPDPEVERGRGLLRAGRKVGRTLYLDDKLVGLVDTPELAATIVRRWNAGQAPT